MFVLNLRSNSQPGEVLATDDAATMEEALPLAEGMINEEDETAVLFENYEQANFTRVDGFDTNEDLSDFYVTIEETNDLSVDDINAWFYEEVADEYDPMDIFDDSWANF